MVLKTVRWISVLLLLAPPLAGQSPLQWPVPPPGPARKTVFPEVLIGPAELARLLRAGAVPLDARGAGPYAESHLPGALSAEEGLPDAGTLVVYGNDREEVARLYWSLRRAGRAEVRILDGGIAAWRAAGRPVETGLPGPRPASAPPPSPGSRAVVDADWVAESFGQEGTPVAGSAGRPLPRSPPATSPTRSPSTLARYCRPRAGRHRPRCAAASPASDPGRAIR
jgi:rhodanese-related sulfurtransferase